MPIFGRRKDKPDKPAKPPPVPSVDLPSGEEVERGTKAVLLQGKTVLEGTLFMTNKRLMFEAAKGDARWMIVPYDEMKSAGLYPFPSTTMGAGMARQQALFIETTKGEQVWLNFGDKDERDWLPLLQQRLAAATATPEDDKDA
jgi:hypothetical protein